MSDPLHATTAWTRAAFDAAGERLFKLGILISTWLVVGNAGALVLAFNAITSGRLCELDKFEPVVLAFVWGLATAFVGVVLNYFSGVLGVHSLGVFSNTTGTLAMNQYYIEKLRADGIETPDDAPLAVDMAKANAMAVAEQKRMWRHWALFVACIVSFAFSAAFFANGVLLTLSDEVAAALCVS
ncbi:hypothetical protein [Terricaulis sp.]|uniref:hypothetical protein n=1 Tax=Terricaulis sp. TaxID=2768686 RepID=UPI002AC73DA0|nr:hypothetical protein [Terricaulis sp.]MDZ4692257.1 hypothetical protein [Terricaulis sp.]